MDSSTLLPLLVQSLAARRDLFDPHHRAAFRLFNGFTEGCPVFSIDLYGSTLLLHNYADPPEQGGSLAEEALAFLTNEPLFSGWLRAAVLKTRNANSPDAKRGTLTFGTNPDDRVREHGVWYALDLVMNRDASLYLDTRNLRKWLIDRAGGKTVLNAFAYTGSFGVAALAGGAARVVQLDLNRDFLNLAKTSYTLNGFPIRKSDFLPSDFFTAVGRLKRSGQRFDLVLIDPPFFSSTSKGRVDQVHDSARLINKVRPLVNDGGLLIAINNALYVSGQDYLHTLESLCADGYLEILEFIPAPQDFTGYPATRTGKGPITDPAPFNHSTKIAVLGVKRKDAHR